MHLIGSCLTLYSVCNILLPATKLMKKLYHYYRHANITSYRMIMLIITGHSKAHIFYKLPMYQMRAQVEVKAIRLLSNNYHSSNMLVVNSIIL